MQDKNELNDIILNKGGATSSNKKLILAVATLGVILIVVVMLMNSLTSNGTENLPQAVLPPEPKAQPTKEEPQEPLFEEIEVVEEKSSSDTDLDLIAQKLKEESFEEEPVVKQAPKPKEVPTQTKVAKKVTKIAAPKKAVQKSASYYIQVGSFSKYKPNKKFLSSITKLGYNYKYHKVSNLNKVLVGPFKTAQEAKNARRTLRLKVEPGAFLVKL